LNRNSERIPRSLLQGIFNLILLVNRKPETFYSKGALESRTHLKNNLSAHGGVANRFKILTYYRVCSAFSPLRAPDDKFGIFDLP
jgi:hypothetical protein